MSRRRYSPHTMRILEDRMVCSRKIRYETKDEAEAFADRVREKAGWKRRPYQCPHCRLWHLRKTGV